MRSEHVSNSFQHNPAEMRRLFMLRNLTVLCQTAAVVGAVVFLKMELPLLPITLIISALALFNLATWLALRSHWQINHGAFIFQLSVDVFALTALLYFTGGATNPFVSLFLIPLFISATVLPARYTWGISFITIVCYSMLLYQYVPLPHMHQEDMTPFGMHVYGMWLGFVLSALIIAYFIVGMGNILRERERALSMAREQSLRDSQLVQLGTLAASTAHELGTPLGTMALLVNEMDETGDNLDDPTRERLNLLHNQIERCKDVLTGLTASAGEVRLSGGGIMNVDDYLKQLHSEWLNANPGVTLNTHWDGTQPAPFILADRTLSQALNNILDNAARVSPQAIDWYSHWDDKSCVMEIRDWGPGLTREASQKIGKQPYTDSDEGLGLGLFLAHAIIGRFGGKVTLFNREEGGTCTRILLPCNSLAGLST